MDHISDIHCSIWSALFVLRPSRKIAKRYWAFQAQLGLQMHSRRTVLLCVVLLLSSSQVYVMHTAISQFSILQLQSKESWDHSVHFVNSSSSRALCHLHHIRAGFAIHRSTKDTNLSHSRSGRAQPRCVGGGVGRARVLFGLLPDSLSERRCRLRSPVRRFGQRRADGEREREREKGKTGGRRRTEQLAAGDRLNHFVEDWLMTKV